MSLFLGAIVGFGLSLVLVGALARRQNAALWERATRFASAAAYEAAQATVHATAKASASVAPPPFVCVLVEGVIVGTGVRAYLGTAGRAGDPIVLRPQQPLAALRVFVFADLELVDVRGIFCGVEVCTVAMGSCPVGAFAFCEPGVDIRIDCRPRD